MPNISPTELRIGNIISFKGLWSRAITEIYKDSVDFGLKGVYPLSECNPIPLSPDILEKCGFVDNERQMATCYTKKISCGERREYSIKEMYSYIYEDGNCKVFYSVNNSTCSVGVKYVHELQNLVFCLTGHEIELNF